MFPPFMVIWLFQWGYWYVQHMGGRYHPTHHEIHVKQRRRVSWVVSVVTSGRYGNGREWRRVGPLLGPLVHPSRLYSHLSVSSSVFSLSLCITNHIPYWKFLILKILLLPQITGNILRNLRAEWHFCNPKVLEFYGFGDGSWRHGILNKFFSFLEFVGNPSVFGLS